MYVSANALSVTSESKDNSGSNMFIYFLLNQPISRDAIYQLFRLISLSLLLAMDGWINQGSLSLVCSDTGFPDLALRG